MNRITIAATLLLAAACAAAAEAPDIVQTNCARCHGSNGIATTPATPHLNGQLALYLSETMQKFQKGQRATPVPDHIPKGLSAEDIAAIASFYNTSKAVRPKQETDPAKVQRGNNIFFSRCVECHADSGRIGDDDAPILNAQELTHLTAQTKAFVEGKRKFVSLMRDAYRGLNDDDLEAVAQYLASIEQYPNEGKKKRRR